MKNNIENGIYIPDDTRRLFTDEIDAAIEEGDMSQAHQLVGDWRKELDDYLALNEKECGTHDDGAGDEAAVAKTKE